MILSLLPSHTAGLHSVPDYVGHDDPILLRCQKIRPLQPYPKHGQLGIMDDHHLCRVVVIEPLSYHSLSSS